MNHAERFEAALGSRDPGRTLREVVLDLAANGYQKPHIYGLLEELLLDLRTRDNCRESDEDAVLDVMDALAGWCHPDARLLPEQNQRVVWLEDDVAASFPDEAAVNEALREYLRGHRTEQNPA